MVKDNSLGYRTFSVINYLILTVFSFLCIYPLINILAVSLSSNEAITRNEVNLWPVGFNVEAYKIVLSDPRIWLAYKNTIVYCIFSVIVHQLMATLVAYPLSKKRLSGRGIFTFILTFTTLFKAGLIPTYLVVRSTGLINTMWALIIPGAIPVWNVIILRTYFQNSIPNELEEAAVIDGAGNFKILMKIFIPLSMPIYAAFTLFFAVGMWNNFFSALIYLNDRNKFPLQVVLRDIIISGSSTVASAFKSTFGEETIVSESLKSATIILVVAPIIMVYPALQKYFIKGMFLGSVKG